MIIIVIIAIICLPAFVVAGRDIYFFEKIKKMIERESYKDKKELIMLKHQIFNKRQAQKAQDLIDLL